MISAEKAEELKMKEKRKREREKNLPRKKRRKLEAAREMLEDEDEVEVKGGAKNNKEKTGIALVDVAYRRAKAVKAANRAVDAGKIVKKFVKKSKPSTQSTKSSRTEEMQELFQGDMSEKRQKKTLRSSGKKKSAFKSKSRYKRK